MTKTSYDPKLSRRPIATNHSTKYKPILFPSYLTWKLFYRFISLETTLKMAMVVTVQSFVGNHNDILKLNKQ